MCSPQSEAELQQLARRSTRIRTSLSSTFNDIRDVIEGQRENEDIGEKRGDWDFESDEDEDFFESDEDFSVKKKKKKRKIGNKKKVKVSKSKTSHDVSLAAPAYDLVLNTTDSSNVKSAVVLQSASNENSQTISPLLAPTALQVANKYDFKIPNIVPHIDNHGTQLLFTQASTENHLPTFSSRQSSAKAVPCKAQKNPVIVMATNDIKIESIEGKGTKIMYTENTSSQPSPTSMLSSQQVAKILPCKIQKLLPGQVGKIPGQPQASKLPGGRGRGQNYGEAGPHETGPPKHLAPGAAPRPARLPRMLRPAPGVAPRPASLPSMLRSSPQMRPRIPGCSVIMSQPQTPTVSPVSRSRVNHGLLNTSPLQRTLFTPQAKLVSPPLVIDLDTDTSPQHHHAGAPITTTSHNSNLVLPPSISITRQPQAHTIDANNISTSNIASLVRTLAKVGDTEGTKCLVLYELTETQIQGLRGLGLSERRI